MSSRRLYGFCALLLAGCLAGCSIMPFEDPAEQRAAEERTAAVEDERADAVDPAALLGDDLVFSRTLCGDAGQVLATYTAHLPVFAVEEERKGVSFERIDQHYRDQLAGYEEDCAGFFDMVKGYYGADWAAAPAPEPPFSTEQSYALAAAPDGYLCVLRTYTVRDNAGEETVRDAEVFLLDSGWRLTLEELFGTRYEEAAPVLLEGIRAWCTANGMTEEAAALLTLDGFAPGYGMDGSSLLFFLKPFTLSTSDEQARIIRLPLSDLADYLPENIPVGSHTHAVNDDPVGAA